MRARASVHRPGQRLRRRHRLTGSRPDRCRWPRGGACRARRRSPRAPPRACVARWLPFRKICARYSPRSLATGAGAGPSTLNRPASALLRRCCASVAASVIAARASAPLTTMFTMRRQRRIPHRLAIAELFAEKRAVVLLARVLDAVVMGIDASARSPRRARLPARRAPPPASAAETCARPRENRRAPARRRPKRPRRASRAENRAPWRSSACRRARRSRRPPSIGEYRPLRLCAARCRDRAVPRGPSATVSRFRARPSRCRTRAARGTVPCTPDTPWARASRSCSNGTGRDGDRAPRNAR